MFSIILAKNRALRQLQWVEEKIRSRKDKFCPFFFDVQRDKNPFFEVFKVPKNKVILFGRCNISQIGRRELSK